MVKIGDLIFDQKTAVVRAGLGRVWGVMVALPNTDPVQWVPLDYSLSNGTALAIAHAISQLPDNCEARMDAGKVKILRTSPWAIGSKNWQCEAVR